MARRKNETHPRRDVALHAGELAVRRQALRGRNDERRAARLPTDAVGEGQGTYAARSTGHDDLVLAVGRLLVADAAAAGDGAGRPLRASQMTHRRHGEDAEHGEHTETNLLAEAE